MSDLPADLYTEPHPIDVDTLARLGPLARLAGVWQGTRGLDVKPKAEGPKKQAYVERIELQPIDPVTNGPQLLYGLRYHQFITKPEQVKTYHDQVGYWLWEPATGAIIQTLTIPRGEVAMAGGTAAADADSFTLEATQGLDTFGICSAPFLDQAFKTTAYRIQISFNADGSWTYDQDTVLQIHGQDQPFHHTDRNTLHRVAPATPNPLARGA
jgi:hypothetical protein